jgi:hypothetical protein
MTSALDITRSVNPPRAVFVNFPLGRQTGKPHQPDLQLQIVRDAMSAFETIDKPGTMVELPYVWDENIDGGRRPIIPVTFCLRVRPKGTQKRSRPSAARAMVTPAAGSAIGAAVYRAGQSG